MNDLIAEPATPPRLSPFATVTILVGEPIELGEMTGGKRRIIPIVGGSISGDGISGEVLPAGADYQTIRSATVTELVAKYAIVTDDGEHINVENIGIRTASEEDTAALAAGEPVPAERVYFRCVPALSGTGRWSHLDERLFIGSGRRRPDRVELEIFEVL